MIRLALLAVSLVVLPGASGVRGQDTEEVKKLKERIELLEAKLKQAEIEIAQLRAKTPGGEKEAPKKASLSDLLTVGKILSGNYRSAKGNGLEGGGEVVITIGERDGKKVKASGVLKPSSKDAQNITIDYEGEIEGVRLTLRSVGKANKSSATLSLKGESLEGAWSNMTGDKGTMAFKLSK